MTTEMNTSYSWYVQIKSQRKFSNCLKFCKTHTLAHASLSLHTRKQCFCRFKTFFFILFYLFGWIGIEQRYTWTNSIFNIHLVDNDNTFSSYFLGTIQVCFHFSSKIIWTFLLIVSKKIGYMLWTKMKQKHKHKHKKKLFWIQFQFEFNSIFAIKCMCMCIDNSLDNFWIFSNKK